MAVSGPVVERSLALLPTSNAGPVVERNLATVPSEFAGPVVERTLTVFPGEWSGPVVDRLLTLGSGGVVGLRRTQFPHRNRRFLDPGPVKDQT